MREKLLQAAIITFLLHLIAGLSPNTQNSDKGSITCAGNANAYR